MDPGAHSSVIERLGELASSHRVTVAPHADAGQVMRRTPAVSAMRTAVRLPVAIGAAMPAGAVTGAITRTA